MNSGASEVGSEMSDPTCRRRAEADRAFRKWLADERIRSRMIEAAGKLAAAIATPDADPEKPVFR